MDSSRTFDLAVIGLGYVGLSLVVEADRRPEGSWSRGQLEKVQSLLSDIAIPKV